jgi:hypothetical protein
VVSYNVLLQTFRAELKEQERYKRDMILKLAQKLEEEKYPTSDISRRLVSDLQGFIAKSYVSMVLKDKKYKDQSKIHEKEREEEDEITVTNDGTVVPNPELEHEQEEHDKFYEQLSSSLGSRTEEVKSLNDVVVKELDKEINLRKELEQRLEQSISHEQYQELEVKASMCSELIENIENHLGEFVRLEKDEDGQIILEEVLSTKDPYSGVLEIDLKKFGNKIKESFQHGNSIAEIEFENYKVKKWT